MGRQTRHGKGTRAEAAAAAGAASNRVEFTRKQQRARGANEAYKKNWAAFNEQLRAYGLTLRSIGSDGNCLFRSLADQLLGDQDAHASVREQIVDYMRRHPKDFAPFVWDCTFEQYLAKMRKNGEWGGAAELAAASKCFGCNITVHQYNAPRLENVYDPASVTMEDPSDLPLPVTRDTKTIHLSYHDAEHYSSVRNISDAHSLQPATPIHLDAHSLAAAAATSASSSSSSSSSGPAAANLSQQERIVMQSTQCKNLSKIRTLLRESWNDANVVVEILIAEQTMGLDINIDHDVLAELQQAEIAAQQREEEQNAAAARAKQREQQGRECASSQTAEQQRQIAQQIEYDQIAAATAASIAGEEQKQKRNADDSHIARMLVGDECKGEPVEPASDDHAEEDDDDAAAGSIAVAAAPAGASSLSPRSMPMPMLPPAVAHAASASSPAAVAVPSSSSSTSAAPSLPPGSGHAATASAGSGHAARLRPPPASARSRVSGREKRQATKAAKALAEKSKRANKALIKQERNERGAHIASTDVVALANKLGAVRI